MVVERKGKLSSIVARLTYPNRDSEEWTDYQQSLCEDADEKRENQPTTSECAKLHFELPTIQLLGTVDGKRQKMRQRFAVLIAFSLWPVLVEF